MIPVSRPAITADEIGYVVSTLQRCWVTQGENVRSFEAQLATYLRVPHVVACSSGTAALHLSLVACGVGPGDEVLVPDLTYVATANAVRYCGAVPVLVDVEPETWLMSLVAAERAVTKRTRAVVPVHLYGLPCDLDAWSSFASSRDLKLVEDSAEALGGAWDDTPCGTAGHCGAFSFYGNKIITTGEGGAVACYEPVVADCLRHLRGQAADRERRYWHTEVGFNYRMTDVHAAIGLAQLRRLDWLLAARARVCAAYGSWIQTRAHYPGRCPTVTPSSKRHVSPWLFTFRTDERDEVAGRLWRLGVETRPAFQPLHRLPMFSGHDSDFPNASLIADTGLSLPTYPDLGECVGHVIDRTAQVLNELGLP